MSIQKYQVFLHVMEAGSVSRAAEDMGLTQSAVSHALSSLEEDFGFKLLTRSRAGVRLSSEGKRILPAIRDILSAEERLRETVSSIHGLSTGTIRVASFSSVAVHWLPAMLKAFQEQYPQIRFKLLNGDYHDVEQWLEEGAVDLGFVSLPTRAPGKVTPLMEDRLLVILPKDHPLASLDSFPIGYARQETFISLLESSDHDLRRALDAEGIRPHIRFITKDDYAIIAMVEQGLGIAIMPELLLRGRTDNIAALELKPQARRTIALAVTEQGQQSPAARMFADFVVQRVRSKALDEL
ncbi:MAG: LysR family transcriptional regulator [Clostridia bacterium]|nr:LysR family transcriptional regulator [Clostridia bacterium]